MKLFPALCLMLPVVFGSTVIVCSLLTAGRWRVWDVYVPDDCAIADEATLTRLLVAVAQREYTPAVTGQGFTDFQLTRGLLGVST